MSVMIYLDNAATTQLDLNVFEEMIPYFIEKYGNPGTPYRLGRDAAAAIDKARRSVAKMFGTTSEHIIFTSGGSEGNSMVFHSAAKKFSRGKPHIVTTKIEHDSVLRSANRALKDGAHITFLTPDENGFISAEAVTDAIIPSTTGLVSVMFANNEIGTVNDIAKIGKLCRKKGILFHCDCVQAAGQYDLNAGKCGFDFATISAHKFHGPKGIGALYVRNIETLEPLIYGGSEQEYGLRGGTENAPAVVGLGVACMFAERTREASMTHISYIKQVFVQSLLDHLGVSKLSDAGIRCNGTPWYEAGKVLNLTIDGVSGESAIITMDALGVCISAGSACTSRESKPSHVLKAIGLSDEDARHSIRISFSKLNTELEAQQAGEQLATCITMLREHDLEVVQ